MNGKAIFYMQFHRIYDQVINNHIITGKLIVHIGHHMTHWQGRDDLKGCLSLIQSYALCELRNCFPLRYLVSKIKDF